MSSEQSLRIKALEAENSLLRDELDFLKKHPKIIKGIKGELLTIQLTNGKLSNKGAGHDIDISIHNIKLEIKYSSLLSGGGSSRNVKRWVWTKLFGESGKKEFDRLILIGDIDQEFLTAYKDYSSPYIFFDLSYMEAVDFVNGVKSGSSSMIHLTTNPHTVRSARAKKLYCNYQTSIKEISARYNCFI
jgi:hypothetical protein